MQKSKQFAPDDYSEVKRRFFFNITDENISADPSGWVSTYSAAEEHFKLPSIKAQQLSKYYIDEGKSLAQYKDKISSLLSSWEGFPVLHDQFTICPSGACASLATLGTLRSLGVKCILFETPAYFGTIEQAQELGISFKLIPTYRRDYYKIHGVEKVMASTPHIALWLTQPRASLGFDQSREELRKILETANSQSYVVVDEATDQTFPSHLSICQQQSPRGNLIRLRSFAKGLGLNGIRLAAVLHASRLRPQMVGSLEAFGGSVDIHSLQAVSSLSDDIPRLQLMLRAANHQVTSLCESAIHLTRGTPLKVNVLRNGYIGSVIADLTSLGKTQPARRNRFLKGCAERRMPIITGASSYFAKDPPFEAIRLNFFSLTDQIVNGINNMLSIWR